MPNTPVPDRRSWQPPSHTLLVTRVRSGHALSPRMRILALLIALALSFIPAPPADAATRGTGFGTWAPISAYGWHGSMIVDGVHTYCITPGAPAPTGQSIDHGVSGSVAGLSPQQLTAINMLVTEYGQTDDPVQAAAVGWAVKAIANRQETLHAFGYRGDSLAGAINWTFSALAPEHNRAVQQLAETYYEEATKLPAGVESASGSLVFTTDPEDHRGGSVSVDATTAAATGSLALTNAVFADTGTNTRSDATPGIAYAIRTQPPGEGASYAVRGTGRFSTGHAAAVRHYTTPGGQDTAGPAGPVSFDVTGADTRVPPFAPAITTEVASRYAAGGTFLDTVSFGSSTGEWPRDADGVPLSLTARAAVYRTNAEPVAGSPLPADAVLVGGLSLTTDAAAGSHRVASEWTMDGPGFYTAVWTIRRDEQAGAMQERLIADYTWVERFGEPGQIMMVPDISTRATSAVPAGEPFSDAIIVGAPLPATGLRVASSVYRGADGVAPADACVPDRLVWMSDWVAVSEPGEYVVTAPPVAEAGTYYWQEQAVDAAGELVHRGACGVANETTTVNPPPAAETPPAEAPPTETPPRAAPPDEAPLAAAPPAEAEPATGVTAGESAPATSLAATGQPEQALRSAMGVAIALITVGGTLLAGTRARLGHRAGAKAAGRRRFGPRLGIR